LSLVGSAKQRDGARSPRCSTALVPSRCGMCCFLRRWKARDCRDHWSDHVVVMLPSDRTSRAWLSDVNSVSLRHSSHRPKRNRAQKPDLAGDCKSLVVGVHHRRSCCAALARCNRTGAVTNKRSPGNDRWGINHRGNSFDLVRVLTSQRS
jgi:hypothetical protein